MARPKNFPDEIFVTRVTDADGSSLLAHLELKEVNDDGSKVAAYKLVTVGTLNVVRSLADAAQEAPKKRGRKPKKA